jgi:hypothetical protein
MKTKKIKKEGVKNLKQAEIKFYKRYLVYNEIQKIIESSLFFELDEEYYDFIQKSLNFKMIADFSDYGNDVFDLNFVKQFESAESFLNYIKFDLDSYVECMLDIYDEIEYN